MRRFKRLNCIFLFIALTILPECILAQRVKFNFNPGWKLFVGDQSGAEAVRFDDGKWRPVTLPHAFNEDEAFKVAIDKITTGIVWYRKNFKIPGSYVGKKVFIEFEGIRQAGTVYLNGQLIGEHENGAMAFGLDVSDKINFGNKGNVIALRIDNSWDYKEKSTNTAFQWSDKNFNANYGGIPKNVYLHITDKLYQTLPLFSNLKTTGVYVYASDIDIPQSSAIITAEAEVKNEHDQPKKVKYEVSVSDMEGKLVKSFKGEDISILPGQTRMIKASAKVGNLNFWSWGYGYLYTVKTSLKVGEVIIDEVQTRTGFRKTAFFDGLVRLNDRVIQLKGYAQRTSNEWPALGLSVPPWISDYSNQLMVESNANIVRWMHITPWKQDVESCDRSGLIQAMPAGDSEKDITGPQWVQRTNLMRDAIIYNRNNPSILFYECGNESISEAHMQEMKTIRDQYDAYGGRAIGSREMLDSKVAEYGGEMLYINKSKAIPMWAMEYSRDEGLRKYWDDYTFPYHKDGDGPLHKGLNASAYNRNQDSHAIENVNRWFDYWRERPGTGERTSSGGVNIVFSDSNTHFRGAENYRRSGEVDALRIAKDGFYAHQVMWDGWVDIENPRIHIIGHWNYKPGTVKDINVISSGEKVELFVNDVSMGYGKQSSRFLYTFKDIQWQTGSIRAVAYDVNNGKLCEAKKIKTAGEPDRIRLTLHQGPEGLKADGADLALVDVEVVDVNGLRCPTALNLINFSLQGPAEWRGGIAQGPDNYILSRNLPVECGVNRIIIRSSAKSGKIVLHAEAEGLKDAELTFASKKVDQKNGLSTVMPAAGLPSYIKRGPTPATPSFITSRRPLRIIAATAGANQDKAAMSFDDNELSDWYNDGNLPTAWINYTLEHNALISEVTLRMNHFRSRSYPIRITIDGSEVFRGETKKSLGYFTAKFDPRRGKNLKIEMLDARPDSKDVFGMVEVTGKKLDDGANRKEDYRYGSIGIVEIEIYEKLTDYSGLMKD